MKILFALSLFCTTAVIGQKSTVEAWETMFNGKDLTGWTPKIRYAAAGENTKNTFRVVDEKLVVSYDQYDTFNEQFGHLFYNKSSAITALNYNTALQVIKRKMAQVGLIEIAAS